MSGPGIVATGVQRDHYDFIVLSPHLDDGVLSCGGRLSKLQRESKYALVVTFCTADVPDDPTPFTREVFRHMNLDPATGMAARRAEDVEACSRLGVDWLHLDLNEAICRTVSGVSSGDDTQAHPYDSPDTLFGGAHAEDAASVQQWLQQSLEQLPTANIWAAPLGIGGHVDHRLVRAAAERNFETAPGSPKLELYEDFPYSRRARNRARVLGLSELPILGALARKPLRPRKSIRLEQQDLQKKISAIGAYASQIRPLFQNEKRLAKRVRQDAQRVGGERVWSVR